MSDTEKLEKSLAELSEQVRGHEQVLAGIQGRRRKCAYAASQGDASALAEIAAIERDEAAAKSGLGNGRHAVEEAKRLLAAAREQDNAAFREASEKSLAALGDDLLAADENIVEAIEALRTRLLSRDAIINRMLASPVILSDTRMRMRGETLAEALLWGVGNHLCQFRPRNLYAPPPHSLALFIEEDFKALGRRPPHRELTHQEKVDRHNSGLDRPPSPFLAQQPVRMRDASRRRVSV